MGGVFGRVIGRTIIAHHAGESSEWSSIDAVNSELTMILTTSTADAEHTHTHTHTLDWRLIDVTSVKPCNLTNNTCTA